MMFGAVLKRFYLHCASMCPRHAHGPRQPLQAADPTPPAPLQHAQKTPRAGAMQRAVELTDPATSAAAPAAGGAAADPVGEACPRPTVAAAAASGAFSPTYGGNLLLSTACTRAHPLPLCLLALCCAARAWAAVGRHSTSKRRPEAALRSLPAPNYPPQVHVV